MEQILRELNRPRLFSCDVMSWRPLEESKEPEPVYLSYPRMQIGVSVGSIADGDLSNMPRRWKIWLPA